MVELDQSEHFSNNNLKLNSTSKYILQAQVIERSRFTQFSLLIFIVL